MRRRARSAAVAVWVAVLLGGCGASGRVVDMGAAPTRSAPDATSSTAPPDGSLPTDQPLRPAPDGTTGAGDGPGRPSSSPSPADPGASEEPDTTRLAVFFTQGEQVKAAPRDVPRVPRVGSAILEQLLGGPTAAERAAGYGTEIPATTRLRDLTIDAGVAVADLSGDFESGGGTLGLTLRLAQVVCTLDQFPTVDGVRFALDGEIVEVFTGDGLIIDEPVACSDYTDNVAD